MSLVYCKPWNSKPAQDGQDAINLDERRVSRLCVMGSAQGDMRLDPLLLQPAGQQRTGYQLIEHLCERKFRASAPVGVRPPSI